jgi:shikimate kinase
MLLTRIFLVGFMGAGKSTVGASLAMKLAWPFIDLDKEIEKSFGDPIHQIFKSKGEPFFRQLETEALKGVDRFPNCVVALGGGTFIEEKNRSLIKQLGFSIFLNLPLETVLQRCPIDDNRPLFQDRSSIKNLYFKRLPIYAQTDLEINASLSPDQIVDNILLKGHF